MPAGLARATAGEAHVDVGSAGAVLDPAYLETVLLHVSAYHRDGQAPVDRLAVAKGGAGRRRRRGP